MDYFTLSNLPVNALEQLLNNGILGIFTILLSCALWKIYKAKDIQQKMYDDEYKKLVVIKDEQEEHFRNQIQQISSEYHNELKELTEQLMSVIKEKSVSETKMTEVLKHLVILQSNVERLLSNFLDRKGLE